ncbi:hypothetical protein DN752_20720 [Echinicola strongylocentroti]|uniref:Glycosyltransferase RgtA/B/C/D-like domain-containing protein n=1 Tax=Echinicola strongylocentroti TaxID=1795355 RepID=A0A2Z4IP17_9BACT|nr:hypothetical protein [Echinicola strongylocentroti]AWW32368.1 hypothetical protein DN752_20720 [Echinicola strongylocentroti]
MQQQTHFSFPYSLWAGILFLLVFWYFGYDGITFSDDVSYLTIGRNFWEGKQVIGTDIFTFRWGAYLLPGLISYIFGFNDHFASISSLFFCILALTLIWKILPANLARDTFVVFFCSSIYLLHFLPKVYPDIILVFWVCLIPVSAIYRRRQPLAAAAVMAVAFFIGFCTKETVVFLAPLPIILFIADYKNKRLSPFYAYFSCCITVIALAYLGYFQLRFDDPFFRFTSIENGHYVSAFSFYDKPWQETAARLTFTPILTFIERTYWIWIVLAVPGMVRAFKHDKDLHLIFGAASLCLLIGFWLMTTSFSSYNPLHLNPRHLIILLPSLSVNIALEAKRWTGNFFWNRFGSLWIAFGGIVALGLLDWKLALFYFAFSVVLLFVPIKWKVPCLAVLMLFPILASVSYQKNLKNYDHFKAVFQKSIENANSNNPLISHDFVVHSSHVLVENHNAPLPLLSLTALKEKAGTNQLPEKFTVLVYNYFKHAYPEERNFLPEIQQYASQYNYTQQEFYTDQWVSIIHFEKQQDLSIFQNHGEYVMITPLYQFAPVFPLP